MIVLSIIFILLLILYANKVVSRVQYINNDSEYVVLINKFWKVYETTRSFIYANQDKYPEGFLNLSHYRHTLTTIDTAVNVNRNVELSILIDQIIDENPDIFLRETRDNKLNNLLNP